ncbi:GDSL esterase/lipase At1g29670-like isoform X1 [Apium graveolens]|uniref:GDSL esterase/lipase At1g29670-like isoform X1 n=1 Tax=Apium graveolens TaxID=4045 RepID=UPI003D7ACB2F
MAALNLLPSMLFISSCFNLFMFSCFHPDKIFSNAEKLGDSSTNIRGMFVFGSSLVDNGNNNFLQNLAKADYLPYGIDFPLGPSGRFTNGKNIIDLLGDQLNFPAFIPVFTDPSTKGNRTVLGVNFASGGSGILDETGSIVGEVMSLNEQIKKFEEVTLPELESQLESSSTDSLSKYLFVVGSGGNDYTLNYFFTKSQANLSVQAFTANLTTTLSTQLKKLYTLGARKFVVMSLYPLGCSPGSIGASAQAQKKGCNQYLNQAAHFFNTNLRSLVNDIRPQMPGSNLVVVNAYKIVRDIIKNPASKGFTDATQPCCRVPSLEEGGNGISCKRGGSTCEDRSKHVYFDGLHPTEAVNVVLATKAFASNSTNEVFPFNIRELAQI